MVEAMFILVLCSSYLSKISALVIRKDQNFPPWNDDEGWWNIYPTTKDPFLWDDWKLKGQTLPTENNVIRRNDNTRVYIAIFLIVFFLIIVIVAYLKYFYFENSSSRASSVSDLLTLCDTQGGAIPHCYSLTAPSRAASYARPHVIVNCIPYLPIYSICKNHSSDKPPDYDDVVQGDVHGNEVFPRVEQCVYEMPHSVFSVDGALRY